MPASRLILAKRCNCVMYPNKAHYNKQAGLGLPVALFIIIIMSLIAVAVNQLTASSSQAYSQNVLSARAFYAGESGAQLRSHAVLATLPCSCGANANVSYSFTAQGLNQCQASTNCSSFIANGETFCTIVSTGSCSSGIAERTIEIRLK